MKNTLKIIEGHKKQGQKILGNNNPSKRPDVRIKISKGVLNSYKNNPELRKSRGTQNSGKRHDVICNDGFKVRSSLEKQMYEMLKMFGIDFLYEKKLICGDSKCYPDFTIETNKPVLIEVTGSYRKEFVEGMMKKIEMIHKFHPEYSMIIATYPQYTLYYQKFRKLGYVDLFSTGKLPDDEIRWLELPDKENIDYNHFLPWHTGKCNRLHGHSSSVSIKVGGFIEEQWLVDFKVIKEALKEVCSMIDHKMIINKKYVQEIKNELVYAEFKTDSLHNFVLPEKEVCIIDEDSTAENLSMMIAREVLEKMPENIFSVEIKFSEGVGNFSYARFDRDSGIKRLDSLKKIVDYHSKNGSHSKFDVS